MLQCSVCNDCRPPAELRTLHWRSTVTGMTIRFASVEPRFALIPAGSHAISMIWVHL